MIQSHRFKKCNYKKWLCFPWDLKCFYLAQFWECSCSATQNGNFGFWATLSKAVLVWGCLEQKNQIVSGMSVPTICAVIRSMMVCADSHIWWPCILYTSIFVMLYRRRVMRVRFVFLEKSVFGDGCSIYQQHTIYKVHYSLFKCLSSKPSKLSI